MKAIKISPTRLYLEFKTRKEMNLANFRITEFSEGKDGFKGVYFTYEEFIDAYSDADGKMDYFSIWDGHNYSYKSVLEFYAMFKKFGFTSREDKILRSLEEITKDGYIICAVEGDDITLKHETAHALFFESEEYRNEVIKIVSSLPKSIAKKFKDALLAMDYSDSVLIDEMHAYLVAYDKEEWALCFAKVKGKSIDSASCKLIALFEKHNNKTIVNESTI